jgi:hypothetical protein
MPHAGRVGYLRDTNDRHPAQKNIGECICLFQSVHDDLGAANGKAIATNDVEMGLSYPSSLLKSMSQIVTVVLWPIGLVIRTHCPTELLSEQGRGPLACGGHSAREFTSVGHFHNFGMRACYPRILIKIVQRPAPFQLGSGMWTEGSFGVEAHQRTASNQIFSLIPLSTFLMRW